jgi:hypothetical protein
MAIKSAPSLLKHSGTKQTGATLGVISTGPSSVRTAMSFSFKIDKNEIDLIIFSFPANVVL